MVICYSCYLALRQYRDTVIEYNSIIKFVERIFIMLYTTIYVVGA